MDEGICPSTPNGPGALRISHSLYSPRLSDLLSRFRREFETVLIDAPPMLNLSDTRVQPVLWPGKGAVGRQRGYECENQEEWQPPDVHRRYQSVAEHHSDQDHKGEDEIDNARPSVPNLNPMVGVVEGFRWALLGTETTAGLMIGVSSIVALVVLVGGAFYFRRMERSFADLI